MSGVSFVDGLALATMVRGTATDRIAPGLSPRLREALEQRLAELRAHTGEAREAALAAVIARLSPPVSTSAALPDRAAAILALTVPRTVGSAWLARAPMPRRGFRPPPALRSLLRRFAYTPLDAAQRAEDLRLGRAILGLLADEPALRGVANDGGGAVDGDAAPPAKSCSPEEYRRLRALALAALAAGAGDELPGALGAMERGRRAEGLDPWARAGRECALVEDAPWDE